MVNMVELAEQEEAAQAAAEAAFESGEPAEAPAPAEPTAQAPETPETPETEPAAPEVEVSAEEPAQGDTPPETPETPETAAPAAPSPAEGTIKVKGYETNVREVEETLDRLVTERAQMEQELTRLRQAETDRQNLARGEAEHSRILNAEYRAYLAEGGTADMAAFADHLRARGISPTYQPEQKPETEEQRLNRLLDQREQARTAKTVQDRVTFINANEVAWTGDAISKHPILSADKDLYGPLVAAEGQKVLRERGVKSLQDVIRFTDSDLRGFLEEAAGRIAKRVEATNRRVVGETLETHKGRNGRLPAAPPKTAAVATPRKTSAQEFDPEVLMAKNGGDLAAAFRAAKRATQDEVNEIKQSASLKGRRF